MKRVVQGWVVAAALCVSSAFAGTNQWTPTGPNGGGFSAVRYLGDGVAVAASLRSIYRTTNHGVSWTRVVETMGTLAAYGHSIAVNPADRSQVIVFSHTALYCSTDRGLTWTQVNNVAGVSVNSLQPRAVSFSRSGGVAWLAAGSAIYRSLDGGLTWSLRAGGIPTSPNDFIGQLDTGPSGTAIEYAQVTDAPYATTDAGLNWNRMTLPVQIRRFAISRQVPGTLLAFGNNGQPYRSTDSGANWVIGGTAAVDAVKYDPLVPGRAHAFGYDSTFRRTDDDAATWTVVSALPVGSPLDFDFDPTDPQRILAVSNATVIASSDGGANWVERVQGIAEATISRFAVGRGAASALYAPTYGVHRAYRRDPASGVWNAIPTLPVGVFGTDFGSSAFTVSPVDGNTIYMAANGVFGRSLNGGTSWSTVGSIPADVRTLVWDPSNELIGYAISANQGAMKTVDGGAHWSLSGNGLPRILSLAVDPQNSSNLWATADFGFTGTVAVYRSTNGGANWVPAANGIPSVFAWTLAIDPTNSAVIYAGTQTGLFKTTNSGADWARVGVVASGIGGGGNVFDISIDPQSPDILYVLDTLFPSAPSRSVDGGATWESLRMPDFGTNNYPIYLTLVPGRRSLLAGAIYNGGIHEMEIAPDLELTTSAGAPLAIGIPHTILLRTRNLGTFSATAARLTVSLPEAAAGYTVNDHGRPCTLVARQLTCLFGIVRPDAAADISVAFTSVTAGEELTAQLSAYEPDSVEANNSIVLGTERRADVRIAVASSVSERLIGERFDYTLTTTNDGPSPAAAVIATLQLPANVTYVSATATGLTCTHNARVVTCEVAALAANATASAVVTVEATTAGAAAAAISVVSTGTDPLLANNSASNSVTVTAPPPPPPPPPPPTPNPPAPAPSPSGGKGGGALDYLLLVLLSVCAALVSHARVRTVGGVRTR